MRDYGRFLRGEREHRGLRQIDLAEGICSVDTISRIENGSQIPSAAIFSMCMERLGVSGFSYGDFFDSASIRMFELKGAIRQAFEKEDLEEVEEFLGELRELKEHGNVWDKQFFEFARARYLHLVGEKHSRCFEHYMNAAMMSLTDLKGKRAFAGRALTRTEISILSEIGIIEYNCGRYKDSVLLHNRIIIHQRKHTTAKATRNAFYGKLLSNTAMCEKELYNEDAVRHITKAQEIAMVHCSIKALFKIIHNRNTILGCGESDKLSIQLSEAYRACNKLLSNLKSYEEFFGGDVFLHLM